MKKYVELEKYLYFTRFEFGYIAFPVILISIAMAVTQDVLIYFYSSNLPNQSIRFEYLLNKSLYSSIFYIAFIIAINLIFYLLFKDFMGTKSIYTLMTTPTPRYIIFLSKLSAPLLGCLTVIAAQLINIAISFNQYLLLVPDSKQLSNAMFLSLLRYNFFRGLIPYRPIFLFTDLISLLFLFNLIFLIVYTVRAKIRWPLALVPIWLILSLLLKNFDLPMFFMPVANAYFTALNSGVNVFLFIIMLLAYLLLNLVLVKQSYTMFKRGEII